MCEKSSCVIKLSISINHWSNGGWYHLISSLLQGAKMFHKSKHNFRKKLALNNKLLFDKLSIDIQGDRFSISGSLIIDIESLWNHHNLKIKFLKT